MKYGKLNNFRIKIRYFCDELTAVQTARLLKLNRDTVDRYYTIFREHIAAYQETNRKKFRGSIEIDESYFGSRHRGDPRGRSTKVKIPVIGTLKRNGQVYTEIIPDASRRSILPIIEGLIQKSRSNIYTDKWKSYDGLVVSGYRHYRINHSKEFARNHNHINGIESFWSYVKRKTRKHNGTPRHTFYLYLKEAELRFNHWKSGVHKLLTQIIFY